jgi:putative transposase
MPPPCGILPQVSTQGLGSANRCAPVIDASGAGRALGQEVIELEVLPDYVHLLLGCDPQFGIHRLVKLLKGYSSHALREEFPALKRRPPSLWTNSYFVATVGGVTLDVLKRYVEGQKGW